MNSSMKKLAALSLPFLLAGMGNDINSLQKQERVIKPDWERKKCKSCINFPKYCSFCSFKHTYVKQNSQACEKYEKRNKR